MAKAGEKIKEGATAAWEGTKKGATAAWNGIKKAGEWIGDHFTDKRNDDGLLSGSPKDKTSAHNSGQTTPSTTSNPTTGEGSTTDILPLPKTGDDQLERIRDNFSGLEDGTALSPNPPVEVPWDGEPTEEELAREARLSSADVEDAQRRSAYLAARNTGANRAAASAVAGNQTNEGGQTSAQSALRNTAVGTQADYLNKMGYANALDMQSENKKKGAFLNTMSGIFSGAGEGASVGASLGGAR